MSEKLRVGILGATGMVGQRFICLLYTSDFAFAEDLRLKTMRFVA